IDVGPGKETGRLAGEQDQARWGPVIEVVEHLRQLGQYFAGKPVHGRLGAVDFQPGDSCRVSAEPEMPESHCVSIVHGSRTSGFTVSTNIAPPCPPPMQMAAMPRCRPRLRRACTRCSTIRAPEAPTGCPIAIA